MKGSRHKTGKHRASGAQTAHRITARPDRVIDLGWLTERRLLIAGIVLILLQGAALAVLFLRDMTPSGGLGPSDYVSFHAAAAFAWAGNPAATYDAARHFAAEQALVSTIKGYCFFFYSPIFLLLLAPLGALPYLPGFLVWSALRLALYGGMLLSIVRTPARLWPIVAMPSVVMMDLWYGQNGMLSAALLGGGTVLLDRRPVLAGLLFGLICYKPQLGLMVPVALIAGGHWRALAAAACGALTLALASLLAFGTETWAAFFDYFTHAPAVFLQGLVDYSEMASFYAASRTLGLPVPVAVGIQVLASLGAAVSVAVIWRRKLPMAVRAPVLLAGTLVAAPVVLPYDLTLAVAALAWIWNDRRERGWRPWEKLAFLALFLGPQIAKTEAVNFGVSLVPLVTLGVLALAHGRSFPRPAA